MPSVLFESTDGFATVTLNRPERLNAINLELTTELHAALSAGLRDASIRAILLTGAGSRAFCAGDDLTETATVDDREIRHHIDLIQDITRLIIYGEKPVIAAVNGWAVGGGFEWVMNCDLSIWSETATAFLPEVSLGLGVTGAITSLLPRLIGWQRARALLLLGEKQSASALLALGLAHRVVPADRLMPEARSLAARLAALPPAAVGGLKRCLALVHRDEIERALAAEADSLVGLFADPVTRGRMADFGKHE